MWPIPYEVICATAGAAMSLLIGIPIYRSVLKYRFRKAIEGFSKTQPAASAMEAPADETMGRIIKACDGLARTANEHHKYLGQHESEIRRILTWANDVNAGIGLFNDRLSQVERAIVRQMEKPPIPTPTVGQQMTNVVKENPQAYPETPPYQYTPPPEHQQMLERMKELEQQNEILRGQAQQEAANPPPMPNVAYAG